MLTILDNNVHMVDGLYSLNDLHKASGGLKRHQPSNFIRRKYVQEMIRELKTEDLSSSDMRSLEPIRVIEGIQSDGKPQGTFVCRELVYSYAMWISPRFQILVIRAFDSLVNHQERLSQRLHYLCQDLNTVNQGLTIAGRFLCIGGKQIKPQINREIDTILSQMQPSLNFEFKEDGQS